LPILTIQVTPIEEILYSNGKFQPYNQVPMQLRSPTEMVEAYDNIQILRRIYVIALGSKSPSFWTQFKSGTIGTIGNKQISRHTISIMKNS